MSYVAETIHNDRLFLRCWHCGDSQQRDYVGHLGIDLLSGMYYCHRCGVGGKLSTSEYLQYVAPHQPIPTMEFKETSVPLDEVSSLSSSECPVITSRYTALETFRDGNFLWWPVRDVQGAMIGKHFREEGSSKHIRNEGRVGGGYGYVGRTLISTNYIKVVEGPFDVLDDQSVCVFGFLDPSRLLGLRYHRLHLIPDGDVWTKPQLLRQFFATLKQLTQWKKYDTLISILPYGKDRDELLSSDTVETVSLYAALKKGNER